MENYYEESNVTFRNIDGVSGHKSPKLRHDKNISTNQQKPKAYAMDTIDGKRTKQNCKDEDKPSKKTSVASRITIYENLTEDVKQMDCSNQTRPKYDTGVNSSERKGNMYKNMYKFMRVNSKCIII